MTNKEAVNWLINITADIGKTEHRDLWHYEQALTEIKDMLESGQPEIVRCGECAYREIRGVDGFCDHITGEPIMVKKTDCCSWAEKENR